MLNIITGKPGSGKSYFAVKKIVEQLTDCLEFERREGTPHQRKIYTNISLNIDEFIRYFQTSEVKKYLYVLDADFFWSTTFSGSKQLCKWWEKFDNNSLIVIDEVQYFLGSGGGVESVNDYQKEFELYISTHRHKGQDLFFITQHQDNILKSCLSMAEGLYRVDNIKSRVIPLIGIPLSDFGVLKRAWGYDQQYALVTFGQLIGRAFKTDFVERVLLDSSIYRLYQTHNKDVNNDRPDLKLSKLGAIFWLIKKHWFHLSVKALIFYLFIFGIYKVVVSLPMILTSAIPKSEKKLDVTSNTDSTPPILPIMEKQENKIVVIGKTYLVLSNRKIVNVSEVFDYEGKKVRFLGGNPSTGDVRFELCDDSSGITGDSSSR